MEELLALRSEAPEFQLSAHSVGATHYDSEHRKFVVYTPEERAGFVDELTEKTKRIFELGKFVSRAFVEIGYLFREIANKNLTFFVCIKSQTFTGIHDFAFKVFGFQKSTTYNLMRIVSEFGDGEGGLSEDYRGYSYSQLVYLLPFGFYERKMFTPEATIAEMQELRVGLKKYPMEEFRGSDYGKKITWQKELIRVREAAAEEAVSEKRGKKEERMQGLLTMLSSVETSSESSSPSSRSVAADASAETAIEAPFGEREGERLKLKNKEARKKWVESVFDGLEPRWTIPELDLKIYRYVFVNGAKLYRFNGVTYWETWSQEPGREDKTVKYFITDSKRPKFDMCRSWSVNQVAEWLTEHGNEI